MKISCNGVDKIENLNKTYNIIKINPNCKVITEEFQIEEIRNSMQMKMNAEPFKIIGYYLPTLTNININNLTENNQKLEELVESHKILDNDQKEINKQSIENHILTKAIEKKEKASRVVTMSLGSISVSLSALVCVIGSITMLCKCIKKKNGGLEFELGTRTKKNAEEK